MPIIDVKNLKKTYKNGKDIPAVVDVTFSVEPGEIYGILGPNGAGKTTTLEIIEGLKEPTSGQIEVLGHRIPNDGEAVRRKIGVQLQTSAYLPDLSLRELLNLFGSFYGIQPDIRKLLGLVGLEEKVNESVKNLSGGQQQRFSIAAALVNDPTILFLDEPTTGLDPRSRRNLWELVRKINQNGITVILTTHYMEEAEYLCHRVAVMDKGKILTIDNPRKLVEKLGQTTQVSFYVEKELDPNMWQKIPEVEKVYSNYPKVILELKSLDSISKILNLLTGNQIEFSGFVVKTATLEDVYLDLTGKEFDS